MNIDTVRQVMQEAAEKAMKRNCEQKLFAAEELGVTTEELDEMLKGVDTVEMDAGNKTLSIFFNDSFGGVVVCAQKGAEYEQALVSVGRNYKYGKTRVEFKEGYNVKVYSDDDIKEVL